MLKVLLADDENRILKNLQNEIPWTQLGLTVTCCANNGLEAASFAVKHDVDIVVTDIRMPILNGLELCKKLHEANPSLQIIIISGYADFAYAQQAIQLGVIGYCLKPIDMTELIGFLRTAIHNIHKDKTVNDDALLDCIEEGCPETIRAAFLELGLIKDSYYVAASVGIHNVEKQIGATLSCRLGKHKYLYFSQTPFNRDAAVKLICFSSGNGGIGINTNAVSATKLGNAVHDVIAMAYQYFINGAPTLCENLVHSSLTDEIFAQLQKSLRTPDLLCAFLHTLQNADCSLLFNMRSAFRFYYLVYTSELLCSVNNVGEHHLYGFEQLASEHDNFNEVLAEILSDLKQPFHESYPTPQAAPSTFLQILRFLSENYEKELSLKKTAETFHMNASYVSQLIKNETGLTYSQYVTELRINKAKELLQTTALSLAEVSEAVGFKDYFYFIKKFKKEVGITPGKFQLL